MRRLYLAFSSVGWGERSEHQHPRVWKLSGFTPFTPTYGLCLVAQQL